MGFAEKFMLAVLSVGFWALPITAYADAEEDLCAAKVLPPARIVLWTKNRPTLPYNPKLEGAKKGDTIVFGDAEYEVGEIIWGTDKGAPGRVFQLDDETTLWVPFLNGEPKKMAEYLKNRDKYMANAIAFANVSSDLTMFRIEHLNVISEGLDYQYFKVEALPKGSVNVTEVRDENSDYRKGLSDEQVLEIQTALMGFARSAAKFVQIESEAVSRILFYHGIKGWFLRQTHGAVIEETTP